MSDEEINQVLRAIGSKRAMAKKHRVVPGVLPWAVMSYAMCGEDLALRKVLKRQVMAERGGFYIDIGCNSPVVISNSYLFYLMGWRGVCIEPNPYYAPQWQSYRPEDTFINAAIGEREGEAYWFANKDNRGMGRVHLSPAPPTETGFDQTPVRVPLTRLDKILANVAQPIDFMSIDIEGGELGALRSNDWERLRPRAILMECHEFEFAAPASSETVAFLMERGYRLDAKVGENVVLIDARSEI